jgi:hypothetical protein
MALGGRVGGTLSPRYPLDSPNLTRPQTQKGPSKGAVPCSILRLRASEVQWVLASTDFQDRWPTS